MTMAPVVLKCPECQRFLAEVGDFARAVCGNCGCELTYKSKQYRRQSLTPLEKTPKVAAAT